MILDTNALSEFLKGQPNVVNLAANVHVVYLPVIILGEYRYGLIYSQLRTVLTAQLDDYEREFPILRIHDLPVLSRDGHFDEVAGLRRVTW